MTYVSNERLLEQTQIIYIFIVFSIYVFCWLKYLFTYCNIVCNRIAWKKTHVASLWIIQEENCVRFSLWGIHVFWYMTPLRFIYIYWFRALAVSIFRVAQEKSTTWKKWVNYKEEVRLGDYNSKPVSEWWFCGMGRYIAGTWEKRKGGVASIACARR